ncbi:MAG: histidine--tRNA ligase, partial [Actinomycetota bacterium]
RVLDCKREGCREIIRGAPSLQDFLCRECREHMNQVIELLKAAGLKPGIEEHLVRGLDYYTRTVFEFQDPSLGAQNAVAAGGRYDHLVGEFGGRPTPAVGFSIGLERVMLAGPSLGGGEEGRVYLLAIGEQAREKAFATAYKLRTREIETGLDHLHRSAKAQMKEADRSGYPLCVILGEEEMAGGYYTLRDMRTGKQEEVADDKLIEALEEKVGGGRRGG